MMGFFGLCGQKAQRCGVRALGTLAVVSLCVAMGLAMGGCGAASYSSEPTTQTDAPAGPALDGGPDTTAALRDGGDVDGPQSWPSDGAGGDAGKVGPDINASWPEPRPQARQCPHQRVTSPVSSFTGTPCRESDPQACQQSCVPAQLPTASTQSDADFFARCGRKEVLCVGQGQAVTTLQEAARRVQSDPAIVEVRVGAGRYVESVTFANLKRDLLLVGQSNDPKTGTRIVAPLPVQAVKDYAAVRVSGVKALTVRRLVLSGYGHGLFVQDYVAVNIDQNHHTANLLNGALLRGAGKVTVTESWFVYNGGLLVTQDSGALSVNINQNHRDGTVAVNIDQNHRLGHGSVAVNIDQNHRIPGLSTGDSVSVNIDQNHRIVAGRSTRMEALRFGLAIEGASEVRVSRSRIAANAVGGVRVSPGGDELAVNIDQSHRVTGNEHIAVNINQDHRVARDDTVAVNIDQNHRVELRGNYIADNGPRGWFAHTGEKAPGCGGGCGSHHFCEGQVCLPRLSASLARGPAQGQRAVVGVGALIAGSGAATLVGNSFFRNDTSSLRAHSLQSLTLEENAFAHGGLRPGVAQPQQYLLADVRLWGIASAVTMRANVSTDPAFHGVWLSHGATKKPTTQALKFQASGNLWSGAGQFLPASRVEGNGLWIDGRAGGRAISVNIDQNHWTNNRRAGLATHGYVVGTIVSNVFLGHPFRALVLHDSHAEVATNNQITVRQNTISGATGYGLQIVAGGAKFVVEGNLIEGVRGVGGSRESTTEGDALNLAALTVSPLVTGNWMRDNHRAGIFLHSIQARIENNVISGCRFGMLMQSASSYQGERNQMGDNQQPQHQRDAGQDFPNRKDF